MIHAGLDGGLDSGLEGVVFDVVFFGVEVVGEVAIFFFVVPEDGFPDAVVGAGVVFEEGF